MKLVQTIIFTGMLLIMAACSGGGNHHQLYQAILTYGTDLAPEQADQLVNDIANRVATQSGRAVQLSDSEAETVAVNFARGKIAPARWCDAAEFALVMVRMKTDRFTSADQTENFLQAISDISSVYSQPSDATERMSGLLNATQAHELEMLSNDPDGSRKLLDKALQDFFERNSH